MAKHISILRGINVGGKKKILMADLKALYQQLGFSNVLTYIQSGNVLFDTEKKESNKKLGEKIKQAIFDKYEFDVPVLVRSFDDIQNTISTNPFLKDKNIDKTKLHVTFLADIPEAINLQKLNDINHPPDEFKVIGKNIFIHCPNGYARTKLTNTFFEKKLKMPATSRNWKTINKLYDLANIKTDSV